MDIIKNKFDNGVTVSMESTGAVFFSAKFNEPNGISRSKIAELIKNHFGRYSTKQIEVEFSEERYTPFVLIGYLEEEIKLRYSLVEHYDIVV